MPSKPFLISGLIGCMRAVDGRQVAATGPAAGGVYRKRHRRQDDSHPSFVPGA